MKQKILTIFLVMGLAVSLFTGCGEQTVNTTVGSIEETEESEQIRDTEQSEDFRQSEDTEQPEGTNQSEGTEQPEGTNQSEDINQPENIEELKDIDSLEGAEQPENIVIEEKETEQSNEQMQMNSEEAAFAYTYTDLNQIMYAKQSVNVRDLPDTDGNKIGGLSENQEVSVIGQCNETGWYRIDYNGQNAYVSNHYLADVPSNNSQSNEASVTVPVQEENVGNLVWVPTNGGTKYHSKSSCSNMKNPMQVSEETAIANGYTPCKKCH